MHKYNIGTWLNHFGNALEDLWNGFHLFQDDLDSLGEGIDLFGDVLDSFKDDLEGSSE